MTTSILVQGWRGINHSYAMVNQYQLLALMRRPELRLFHEDVPFYHPHWNAIANFAGFDEADSQHIAALSRPCGPCDVVYRIAYPFRFAQTGERTFCFATSEYLTLTSDVEGGEQAIAEAVRDGLAIITPSHWSRQAFLRHGFAQEKVHVVPHGVDPAIFRPVSAQERAEARQTLGIRPELFVFLHAGAVTPNKGIDLLLTAFARLRRKHPQAALVIKDQRLLYLSTGREVLAAVRKEHPELWNRETLCAVGMLGTNFNLAQMRLLYGAADAYVSPYRAEGFNLPPLEAAACGLPVLLTEGGATDDYAHPSFAGKIASTIEEREGRRRREPDPDSLLAGMEALIEGRLRQDRPAAEGWIARNFTWNKVTEKLLAVFEA